MREMKFRAIINATTVIPFTLADLVNPEPIFSIRELVIPWLRIGNVPDMHTGLKDKNGKEIYDKDIVEDDSENLVGIIDWHFDRWYIKKGLTGGYSLSLYAKHVEVIGREATR